MSLLKKSTVVICCSYLYIVSCWQLFRADESKNDVQISKDPVADELAELGKEYYRLNDIQIQTQEAAREATDEGGKLADAAISDEEWLKRERELEANAIDPDVEMLPRMFDLAKRHPDSPSAFDALLFVITRGGPQTGNVHGKPWQHKEDALDVVWASHAHDPRMFIVLDTLAGSLPSRKTEAFLRRALQDGPNKTIKAAAVYNLARYYQTLARVHQRSQEIEQKERLLNFERYWKVVVTPYLKKDFPLNEKVNSAKIDCLLRLIADEYADVAATHWKRSGHSGMSVELTPFDKPKTYGEMAAAMSFELNNIIPGKPAPEIDGTDADGIRFRLSDYRGKVVLLTFTANWCGPCVAMHPLQRTLVEKYRDRPFVMLSVSGDEKIDTLKAATASGEIPWRCWWDGMDGPIRKVWNGQQGIPRFILLDDKHVIQPVALHRFSTLAEFEQSIDTLLKSIPPGKPPSP